MIIMRIKADGMLNFKDFDLCLSYPKRIANSTIGEEWLKGYPNFRYRKAIILVGSNATGKTCLGRLIHGFAESINSGHEGFLAKLAKRGASLEITFVNKGPTLFKVGFYERDGRFLFRLYEAKIDLKDSFETSEGNLRPSPEDDIKAIRKRVGRLDCQFAYPEISESLDIDETNREAFLKTLRCVIKTLDPSLGNVSISKEIDNSFIMKRGADTIIIQDGRLLNGELLSSGTVEGIDVALFLASMASKRSKLYYCDEHFSYIHSDIEKRIFSIMVGKLKDDEQLFFTTHNLDLLDLNVPKHTFAFLRRDNEGSPSVIFADARLKRNTDSVRCAFENDVFDASPDLTALDELEDGDE